MAERMGRFLSALHSANQPKVKVGDKVKAIKGGDFSGTVEKVKDNGSVSFRHPNGKLYRTHHTNVRVVKEDTDSEGDTVTEGWREDKANDSYGQKKDRRDPSRENQTRRAFIDAMKKRKKLRESAEQNDRVKKVMDKYRGIRNKVNTKPELNVSIRNTSPNIMGNIPGHEGPKPNANF